MRGVLADVSNVRGRLRLIVTKDQCCARWGWCDAGNNLGICIDYSLRETVGLGATVTHDPGRTG